MGKSLKYGEFTFSSDPVGGSKGYARGGACKPMAKADGGPIRSAVMPAPAQGTLKRAPANASPAPSPFANARMGSSTGAKMPAPAQGQQPTPDPRMAAMAQKTRQEMQQEMKRAPANASPVPSLRPLNAPDPRMAAMTPQGQQPTPDPRMAAMAQKTRQEMQQEMKRAPGRQMPTPDPRMAAMAQKMQSANQRDVLASPAPGRQMPTQGQQEMQAVNAVRMGPGAMLGRLGRQMKTGGKVSAAPKSDMLYSKKEVNAKNLLSEGKAPNLPRAKGSVNMAKGGMTPSQQAKVGKVMGEYKAGELHSGSKTGPMVKDRKQAVAIGFSEARKAGKK